MNKNFHNVTIHKTAYDKARFLAKVQNKPISAVLEELLNAVYGVACTYKELNLSFETCVTDSTVLVSCKGKNRMVVSSFEIPWDTPQKVAEDRIHAEIEETIQKQSKKRKGD